MKSPSHIPSYAITHPFVGSNPSSLSSSSAASFSLCFSLAFDSTGNQSCMKLRRAQSTLAVSQGKRKVSFDRKDGTVGSEVNLHRSAVDTVGALHIGQLPSPLFCSFTKHLFAQMFRHLFDQLEGTQRSLPDAEQMPAE